MKSTTLNYHEIQKPKMLRYHQSQLSPWTLLNIQSAPSFQSSPSS